MGPNAWDADDHMASDYVRDGAQPRGRAMILAMEINLALWIMIGCAAMKAAAVLIL